MKPSERRKQVKRHRRKPPSEAVVAARKRHVSKATSKENADAHEARPKRPAEAAPEVEDDSDADADDDDEFESDGELLDAYGAPLRAPSDGGARGGADAAQSNGGGRGAALPKRVYIPGAGEIAEDEQLVHDKTAYDLYLPIQTEWPALSFDFLRDSISGSRNAFPMTAYAVLGSQAEQNGRNSLTLLKMSQMQRVRRRRRTPGGDGDDGDDDDDDSDSDSDDSDADASTGRKKEQALLEHQRVKHEGTVNRVRCMPQRPHVVATWSELGRVSMFDVTPCLDALDRGRRMAAPGAVLPAAVRPTFSFGGHHSEGFALDWSPTIEARMITGDCRGSILLWAPTDDGRFHVELTPYHGHRGSVEDLRWSPGEADVFASCSVDRSIRFWDTRQRQRAALSVADAHESDVNVLSWNAIDSYLLLSGGDDGKIKVWDLRALKDGEHTPAAEFDLHRRPITSVEWHPAESSMLAASSEDNTVSVWDLAVERDAEEEMRLGVVLPGAEKLPPQLLFLHMGQRNVKELHWHPQLPNVLMSTAEDGLNIFRPADIG